MSGLAGGTRGRDRWWRSSTQPGKIGPHVGDRARQCSGAHRRPAAAPGRNGLAGHEARRFGETLDQRYERERRRRDRRHGRDAVLARENKPADRTVGLIVIRMRRGRRVIEQLGRRRCGMPFIGRDGSRRKRRGRDRSIVVIIASDHRVGSGQKNDRHKPEKCDGYAKELRASAMAERELASAVFHSVQCIASRKRPVHHCTLEHARGQVFLQMDCI